MIAAFLRAASLFEDPWLRDFALQSLETVVVPGYVPGGGVAHELMKERGLADPCRGLLGDQIRVASALLWAHLATNQLPYSMLAVELVHFAIRTLWDEEALCFRDRPWTGCRSNAFALNCDAACVLHRLSTMTERHAPRGHHSGRAVGRLPASRYLRGAIRCIREVVSGVHLQASTFRMWTGIWIRLVMELAPALQNIATRLRTSNPSRAPRGGSHRQAAVLPRTSSLSCSFTRCDSIRRNPPGEQRSLHPQRARGTAALRGLGRSRHRLARRTADAPAARRIWRPSHAAAAVRGCGHRFAGSGHLPGVGTALNARRIGSGYRTCVCWATGVRGGIVLEAATAAEFHALDNLCAIVDVNGLGQSRPTMFRRDSGACARRWRVRMERHQLDGHDVRRCSRPSTKRGDTRCPTVLLARTLKGRACPSWRKEGWHGKALSPEQADAAIKLTAQFVGRIVRRSAAPGGSWPDSSLRERRRCRLRRPATRWARAWPPARHRDRAGQAQRRRQPGGGGCRCEELHLQRQVREAPSDALSVLHRRAGDDRRNHGAGRARPLAFPSRVSDAPCIHPHGGRQHSNVKLAGSHVGVSIGMTARRRWDWKTSR